VSIRLLIDWSQVRSLPRPPLYSQSFKHFPLPARLPLRYVFQNLTKSLTKLFSLIALIDRNPQWFQFLVLIRLHRLQVGVPHRLVYRKGIAALFHRVGVVGVPC
jgi:hypothetical protein